LRHGFVVVSCVVLNSQKHLEFPATSLNLKTNDHLRLAITLELFSIPAPYRHSLPLSRSDCYNHPSAKERDRQIDSQMWYPHPRTDESYARD
jgi:hypothetical protein